MTFRVVGYLPDWAGPPSQVQYSRLTHLCYAFALPADDKGGLRFSSTTAQNKLRDVVIRAHGAGCKVLISVYGGLGQLDTPAMRMVQASNRTAVGRSNTVRNILQIVRDYDLDGVDMDWEYPTGQGGDFTALMRSLRERLPADKSLAAAVIAGANYPAGLSFQADMFQAVDWLGIMTYDDALAGQSHASYDFMTYYCGQWLNRGLPSTKLVAGIPFYSRPAGKSYAQYVAADRSNADRDVVDGSGYNGRPTVRRKTEWALDNAGGVMFWELSQDTRDDTSLVSTVNAVVAGRQGGDWFTECFGGTS